jgi:acetate kinase
MPIRGTLLALNAGSSNTKFQLYDVGADGALTPGSSGRREGSDPRDATAALGAWLREQHPARQLVAVGHRVVHGGRAFALPVRVDAAVVAALEALVPLAPLHQPQSLAMLRAVSEMLPGIPQVACFDTAFHRTQPALAQAFALPRRFTEEGVHRYGFHGLSYEHVASVLPALEPRLETARVVVAHLGNGASLCALRSGHSVATTMGFSAIDGLVMGTRSGSLDPGVLLYLMDRYGMDARALERLLYQESGLLGVSQISSDMRTLLASPDPRAQQAVDLFVYRLGRELGSLAAALGGLDALVFTGGIGENSAAIRSRVCRDAAWLRVVLDEAANAAGGARISAADSRTSAWVVRSDENLVIARHTLRVLGGTPAPP